MTFAFQYGRKPAKNAPALKLGPLLTGVVPAHPTVQDNLALLHGGWRMLGNDLAGDCVSVTWANFRRLMTAVLAGREVYPTLDQVWALYKTQNPNFDPNGDPNVNGPGSPADGGMDIQTVLEYLVKVGGPDGVKALAFAKVDHTNVDEVKAAISIFGAVWVGCTVTSANENEFGHGEPWDYVSSSPTQGGHSIITGGFTSNSGGDEEFITWAAETSFTDAFWSHQVDEAWVVIWPEHAGTAAFQQGIDTAALEQAYLDITGKTLVLTPPAPAPTPTPAPPAPTPNVVADAADEALAPVLKRLLGVHSEPHYLHDAATAWLAAKQL